MSKEYIIFGANGQLGTALKERYPDANSYDIPEADITSMDSLRQIDWQNKSVILNAAALTAVDLAESPEGREKAWQVNAVGVQNLAKLATEKGLQLIHISSDYVFDGTKPNHSEDEPFSPLSVYGASKAAGDIAASMVPTHHILRTSWVVGDGKNFIKTMYELAQKGVDPAVVNDQFGRLTFTSELVRAIDHVLSNQVRPGTYNVTNSGPIKSWAEIAADTFELSGFDRARVKGVSSEEYARGKENFAPRPNHSDMDLTKIQSTGFISQDYELLMKDYVIKLKEQYGATKT